MAEKNDIHLIDKDEVDLHDFWAIDAEGMAWTMALTYLTKDARENALDFMMAPKVDGGWRYFLNKKTYPAERIAKLIGVEVERLTDEKKPVRVITLPPLEKSVKGNQPQPTVPYWGNA